MLGLQVHNMKEFEFEPGLVVLDICRIYTHLGSSDDFCAAVSRDGRSYNAQLFPQAETVLGETTVMYLLIFYSLFIYTYYIKYILD